MRLRYGPPTAFATQRLPWSHDYPVGEQHFMKIVNELTLLEPAYGRDRHPGFDDRSCSSIRSRIFCEPGLLEDDR